MNRKTKIVLVVDDKELQKLRDLAAQHTAVYRSIGILREATIADAARTALVSGLATFDASQSVCHTRVAGEFYPQEEQLSGAVSGNASPDEYGVGENCPSTDVDQ